MRIRVKILKPLMFFSILIFVFYTMFYQHMVGDVDAIRMCSYLLMFLLSILATAKDIKKIKKIIWIILFIVFAFISGTFFSVNGGKKLFFEMMMRVVSYFIVMYCVYCYIENNRRNFTSIMLIIWFSALMLVLTTFFMGKDSTYYGGISIGELNKNMLSCYITMGFFANLYLLYEARNKWKKVLLLSTIILEVVAQLNAASRTGTASIILLIFAYIDSIYFIKYENKWMSRIIMICIISIGLIWFYLDFTKLSDVFIVIERFRGLYTVGDGLRKNYQTVAWNMFLDNPIFGKGLGCVSMNCGTYSHSFYYELLASTGLIGLTILAGFLIRYMIAFLRFSCCHSKCMENRLFARLMSWSILLIFVTGISQVYIYYFFFYIYIAIWISAYGIISNEKVYVTISM